MSNLRLINETVVADGVTSVNITDVFSADFDIYKITASVVGNSISYFDLNGRFINSTGSVITSLNYDYAYLAMKAWTTFGEGRAENQNRMFVLFGENDQYPQGSDSVTWVFNPFSDSLYTFVLNQSMNDWDTFQIAHKYISVLTETTSVTGFNAYVNASALGTGTVFRTYGLRVD